MTKLTLPAIAALFLIFNSSGFAGGGHDHDGSHSTERHEGPHDHGSNKAELRTIAGEVVDLSCFIDHQLKGRSHKKCAVACAKKGLPMGILTESNDLYLLIENHDKAEAYKETIEHAAETVTVKGKVYNVGGVQAIQVSEIKHHH